MVLIHATINSWLILRTKERWTMDSYYSPTRPRILSKIPQFQHIFWLDTMDAASMLWLLADNQLVDTDIVLPFIVEKAWVHRVMVISNNLFAYPAGILLGLYPDNIALGQALGQQALALMRQPDQTLGIRPMTAVKRAINLRIAVRLGLTVNQAVQNTLTW